MAGTEFFAPNGQSAFGIVPLTRDSSGAITGIGTAIKCTAVVDVNSKYAKSAAAASTTNITVTLANSNTVETPQVGKAYDMKTGAEKAGGSGGESDTLGATIINSEQWFSETLAPLRGEPVLLYAPSVQHVDSTLDGWKFMIGQLTTDIAISGKANTVLQVPCDWAGKSMTATSGGETALATTLGSITPIGGTALTPPALTSDDVDALLTGVLVWKTNS